MGAAASTLWFVDTPDPVGELRTHADGTTVGPISTYINRAERVAKAVGDLVDSPHGFRYDRQSTPMVHVGETSLALGAAPESGQLFIGCYPDVTVVCSSALQAVTPSKIDPDWLDLVPAQRVYLISTDPSTNRGTYAYWHDGVLKRSFSADPIDIFENEGLPEVFERPFWAGDRPLQYAPGVTPDPQALPFHPQELAEQANREWLGFRYTLPLEDADLDPRALLVSEFQRRSIPVIPPTSQDSWSPTGGEENIAAHLGDPDEESFSNASSASSHDGGSESSDPDTNPLGFDPIPRRQHTTGQRIARWFGFGKPD